MSTSLRDQLLQVGLISQKQANEAEREADRQAQRHRHQGPRKGRDAKVPAAAPARTPAAAQSAAAPTVDVPKSVAPAAPVLAAKPVLAQASVLAAKLARDQAHSLKQQEKAKKKALHAQIKQLVDQHRLPTVDTDEPYSFVHDGKIRRIKVNSANRSALARGEVWIVHHEGRYDLVTTNTAARIRERDVGAIVTVDAAKSAPLDEAYKDFEVPDDLMW